MKAKKIILAAFAGTALIAAAGGAQARDGWREIQRDFRGDNHYRHGYNDHGNRHGHYRHYAPRYYAPAPVYYAPRYYAPRYYAPAPVYYQPAPVIYGALPVGDARVSFGVRF